MFERSYRRSQRNHRPFDLDWEDAIISENVQFVASGHHFLVLVLAKGRGEFGRTTASYSQVGNEIIF